jgi:tRNA threonylcarbamoyladenosine biosynthesis protein TsaB
MLLLATDTSGKQGGVALARDGSSGAEIVESVPIVGGTFSAELIPQIAELLSKHGFTPQSLTGLVAVTGPGSFTGIRVGLTAVKGLAEVLSIPIAAVTSLELLLSCSEEPNRTMAVIDAGRNEVYAAIYKGSAREERLLTIEGAAGLAQASGLRVVASDANIAGKFSEANVVSYRSSEIAAKLGAGKLKAGDTIDVLALDANYIRKSEAEYMQKMRRS